MDVALENVGSMWLLEGKHTDPSIGFLGVGITVASPELLTHWAVFSQPHFWNIRAVFTVFREKLCLGGFGSPGVSKLLCAASKTGGGAWDSSLQKVIETGSPGSSPGTCLCALLTFDPLELLRFIGGKEGEEETSALLRIKWEFLVPILHRSSLKHGVKDMDEAVFV